MLTWVLSKDLPSHGHLQGGIEDGVGVTYSPGTEAPLAEIAVECLDHLRRDLVESESADTVAIKSTFTLTV